PPRRPFREQVSGAVEDAVWPAVKRRRDRGEDGTHAGRPSGKDIRKLGGEGHGARPAVVPSVEPAQGGGETVGAAPDLERLLAPDEAASCAPTLEARRLEMN